MADQKRITLRDGHATPNNIILYELPVATQAPGTTIVLYEGHATPNTIVIRNPAEIPVAGGDVTFTLAATEAQDVAAGTATNLIGLALSATEAQDTFAGTASIVAVITMAAVEAQDVLAGTVAAVSDLALAATEAQDVLAGTVGLVSLIALTATEAADTFGGTTEAVELVVATPALGPVYSGGKRKRRREHEYPVPPKHLTDLVFRNDRPTVETAEAGPSATGDGLGGAGAVPLPAPPLDPKAAAALAQALGGTEGIVIPPQIAATDDEDAMMLILALAA